MEIGEEEMSAEKKYYYWDFVEMGEKEVTEITEGHADDKRRGQRIQVTAYFYTGAVFTTMTQSLFLYANNLNIL